MEKTKLPFKLAKKNGNTPDLTEKKRMELTSRMKMVRFQTFWIQMRNNKPSEESRKTDQTQRPKWHFTPFVYIKLEKFIC
ncbi:hypothetical protein Hanom_Chr16g01493401 [Helianthus anomalus]